MKYNLNELLNNISDDNIHGETNTGISVGYEIDSKFYKDLMKNHPDGLIITSEQEKRDFENWLFNEEKEKK